MIGKFFSEYPWLWPLLWQSTLCLAAGLGASTLLRRRPAQAHQLLLTGLLAAMVTPGAYLLVRHMELGLFVSAPPPMPAQAAEMFVLDEVAVEAPALMDTYDASSIPAVSEQAAPPALSTPLTAPAIPWHTVVLLGWIGASAIPLARLVLRFALGARLAHTATSTDSVHLGHALETAKARLGISGGVRIRTSARVRSPIIWCWTRTPVLLVQADAAEGEDDTDWAGVFCHELAHWKRLDHISGLVTELLACALPWHPLVWWARRRLLRLSEHACDDWVLAGGQSGVDYAESLLGLSAERRMAFVPTIVGKEKAMKARIRRIITDRCGDPRVGKRWALAVSLFAVLATMGVAFAQRRPAPPERRNFEDRREVREPRERQEAQERITARQREALQRMLDALAGRIREKETLLRERGDELGEEGPVIELEADLLREQAEQIERRLRNLDREREEQTTERPRAESREPARPREEFEAQFEVMRRHLEELGEEAGRIERRMGQLQDGQDEEARELQGQLRGVHERMGGVQREMADLQQARAEMQRARAMEAAQRARAESDRVGEVAERTQDLSRRRRDLQVQLREVQRELGEHPDEDSDEARALRRELDGIQEEIAGAERERNEIQRERAALTQIRRGEEPRQREERVMRGDEFAARRQELLEQIRRTEREIQELQEQDRGRTDESRARRMALDRLIAEMQSIEERARSRPEGEERPRAERRAEGRGRIVTRIFRLEHARPEQMAAILHGLAGPGGRVIPDERTGSLIVSHTPEGQEQLERIILELDVPGPDGERASPEAGRVLENEIEELRGQVRGLHDQMQQMREMLQQLVERGPNEEPADMR